MNAFELLLKQYHDRYEAAATRVRAAGITNELSRIQSEEHQAVPVKFWLESLDSNFDHEMRLPGTRGGLLWRYVIAMGTWVSLLARVNNLLGPIACRKVQGLGNTPGINYAPDRGRGLAVIESALKSPGFREYAEARFGKGIAERALKQQLKSLLKASVTGPVAETVDFLTHMAIQDFELADVAGLPDAWESLQSLHSDTHLGEAVDELGNNAGRVFRDLAALSEAVSSQRQGLRQLAQQALESDGRLRSLFLSRVLPFTESHFLVAGKQGGLELATTSFAFTAIEQDYISRLKRRSKVESNFTKPSAAAPWVDHTVDVLHSVSVPFLYWCAKSRIPLAQLWSCDADTISLWPHSRFSSQARVHVAVASMVEKRSFRGAMQFLVTALQDRRGATCLLVTDHWNEEEAVAAYQVVPNSRLSGSIVVLRSDGPRYPISVFEFPAR